MDIYHIKNILTLLTFIIIKYVIAHQKDIPYTPVKNICKICVCLTAQDDTQKIHHVLSCSTKNFKHILADWPEEFGTNHTGQEIIATFSGNSISLLQQIPQTKGILSFSCRHCDIKEIQSPAFVDVPNILRLDLSWNQLNGDVLRPDVFRGPYNVHSYEPISLEDLNLSNNNIHTLDKRIFEHVPNLKKLNLAYNKFDVIDVTTAYAIGSATELEYLDLSHNGLKKLPDSLFKQLFNLKELNLEENNLKIVPAALSLLGSSLLTLNLGNNPIENINSNSFIGLKLLRNLNISGMNQLKIIENESFSMLKKLEVLLCRNNPLLTSIDFENIKSAENLKELDISNCALKTLVIEIDLNQIKNNATTSATTVSSGQQQKSSMWWKKLRILKISNNPWNCDCMIIKIFEQFKQQFIHAEDKPRCKTPYDLAGSLIYDLSGENICNLPMPRKLKIPIHDPPAYLEPKSLALSIVTVSAVVAFGLLIGFGAVILRRKLRKDDFAFTVPIRYTTVRNSTISVE